MYQQCMFFNEVNFIKYDFKRPDRDLLLEITPWIEHFKARFELLNTRGFIAWSPEDEDHGFKGGNCEDGSYKDSSSQGSSSKKVKGKGKSSAPIVLDLENTEVEGPVLSLPLATSSIGVPENSSSAPRTRSRSAAPTDINSYSRGDSLSVVRKSVPPRAGSRALSSAPETCDTDSAGVSQAAAIEAIRETVANKRALNMQMVEVKEADAGKLRLLEMEMENVKRAREQESLRSFLIDVWKTGKQGEKDPAYERVNSLIVNVAEAAVAQCHGLDVTGAGSRPSDAAPIEASSPPRVDNSRVPPASGFSHWSGAYSPALRSPLRLPPCKSPASASRVLGVQPGCPGMATPTQSLPKTSPNALLPAVAEPHRHHGMTGPNGAYLRSPDVFFDTVR
ncbi:hypothetical protein FS749_000413 [Ceratobasidium sp. UAMH 11750]|nr:hypothetical protein FS749_000413 [Ceratobasidium sp. UAMH 11750]